MIKRYIAEKDTTIADSKVGRASGDTTLANTGASDSLEVFTVYGRNGTTDREKARILLRFPSEDIKADYDAGLIPDGATYVLRLFHVNTVFNTPKNFTLEAYSISESWDEGSGINLDTYGDAGAANWNEASEGTSWTTAGALQGSDDLLGSEEFTTGLEDLEIDITSEVETWLVDANVHSGILIKFNDFAEDTSEDTFYTKRFSARSSEFYLNRPIIEVRYDDSISDDRSRFETASPILPASDSENTNTLYFFSYFKGALRDLSDPFGPF